jgi:diphthamide synthase subunit DPH2
MLKRPFMINPVMRMWLSIDGNSFLRHSLSEYLKVVEIGIAIVLGSVQDERTFSTISFLKNKVRNRLTTHLAIAVGMKNPELLRHQFVPL